KGLSAEEATAFKEGLLRGGGHKMPVDDNDQSVTWVEFIFLVVSNTLLMIPNNLINIIMFTIIGALGGWLLGLTSVGAWIAGGLKLVHIEAQAGDIYKVGA